MQQHITLLLDRNSVNKVTCSIAVKKFITINKSLPPSETRMTKKKSAMTIVTSTVASKISATRRSLDVLQHCFVFEM